MRGQALETISIIAKSVGAVEFRPALPRLVDILIGIQESNLQESDPQRPFIMTAWERLCSIYGYELAGSLGRILPSLLGLVKRAVTGEIMLVGAQLEEGRRGRK